MNRLFDKEVVMIGGERSLAAKEVNGVVAEEFMRAINDHTSYSSFIAVGGTGFGDFDPSSSDIDTWTIIPDQAPIERLKAAGNLHNSYEDMQRRAIARQALSNHNFRHPSTILTETESIAYRTAFAAKIGLPVALGVFPVLLGEPRYNEEVFTEEQLMKDLVYSNNVFYQNVLNPPQNSTEDPTRYVYKRATYFLRFKIFYESGIYIPSKADLLSASNELDKWGEIVPLLHKINDKSYSTQNFLEFQDMVAQAMERDMVEFSDDGILDRESIAKGKLRTQTLWTAEKLRWDYLLLKRSPDTLHMSMTNGNVQLWAYSLSQIDQLFLTFFDAISDTHLEKDWERFKARHVDFLSRAQEGSLVSYYENVYHPGLLSFFDQLTPYISRLF